MTETKTYKHAVSVTGQVFFCAAPIRLDIYDGCQFGCVYCFSRKRARLWSDEGIHEVNVAAFALRLKRVQSGEYLSALDEFLAVKVPIQLGGLHDPFTPRERERGVALEILNVLRDRQYPTLISTKGESIVDPGYIALLKEMNVVARFSAAGVHEKFRSKIDRRCASFERTLEKIHLLSRVGIATALRIQPVLPGFEDEAVRMAVEASRAGARKISFEYLKIPNENLRSTTKLLSDAMEIDFFARMKTLGLTMIGWDYTLSSSAKRPFVLRAREACKQSGVLFGAGDTEFIPWSDSDGCCGSSSSFLAGSTQFRANFVGAIKAALLHPSHEVRFESVEQAWSPRRAISTYLASRSRHVRSEGTYSDWLALVATRWNGNSGPYSPAFFDGVEWRGKTDANGLRIYDATPLAKLLAS